ncbi:MAG: hypothetical protein E5V22_07595 [Mesorhizobium sp.]|nr:MAG: hypothetical protein E5V22_07595 [Mesorhizobium sp.]
MIADVVIEVAALGKGRFERGEGFRRHAVNDLGDDVFQVHSRFMRRHSRGLGNRRYDEPISQNNSANTRASASAPPTANGKFRRLPRFLPFAAA